MQPQEAQRDSAENIEAFASEILEAIPAPKSSFSHVGAASAREATHVMPSMTGLMPRRSQYARS